MRVSCREKVYVAVAVQHMEDASEEPVWGREIRWCLSSCALNETNITRLGKRLSITAMTEILGFRIQETLSSSPASHPQHQPPPTSRHTSCCENTLTPPSSAKILPSSQMGRLLDPRAPRIRNRSALPSFTAWCQWRPGVFECDELSCSSVIG